MYFSIIIPLYNKADFITDAIQSVLNQSHQNFEAIVVNDGSIDDGASRVQAIHDHRIKLIQQANSGVSCARNQGIELAKGDLICFLDADDWYLPTYLETIASMALHFLLRTIKELVTWIKRASLGIQAIPVLSR